MKKVIALVLATVALVFTLTGCLPLEECDFCGETRLCKSRKVFGETWYICAECAEILYGDI